MKPKTDKDRIRELRQKLAAARRTASFFRGLVTDAQYAQKESERRSELLSAELRGLKLGLEAKKESEAGR